MMAKAKLDKRSKVFLRSCEVIRRPVITEKATYLSSNNQVVFRVLRGSIKSEIKAAVENLFGVRVKSVNTVNQRGKEKVSRTKNRRGGKGFRASYKKAIISLFPGESIDFSTDI